MVCGSIWIRFDCMVEYEHECRFVSMSGCASVDEYVCESGNVEMSGCLWAWVGLIQRGALLKNGKLY